MSRKSGIARYAQHVVQCAYIGLTFAVLAILTQKAFGSVESNGKWVVRIVQWVLAVMPEYRDIAHYVVPICFSIYAAMHISIVMYAAVRPFYRASSLKRSRDCFWSLSMKIIPAQIRPVATRAIDSFKRHYVPLLEQYVRNVGAAMYPYVRALHRTGRKHLTK